MSSRVSRQDKIKVLIEGRDAPFLVDRERNPDVVDEVVEQVVEDDVGVVPQLQVWHRQSLKLGG